MRVVVLHESYITDVLHLASKLIGVEETEHLQKKQTSKTPLEVRFLHDTH